MKVGFIGTGNMASAIIKGMIKKEHTKSEDIFVFDIEPEKLNRFTSETETNACTSNEELVNMVDVLVLAVKPNVFEFVLPPLQDMH